MLRLPSNVESSAFRRPECVNVSCKPFLNGEPYLSLKQCSKAEISPAAVVACSSKQKRAAGKKQGIEDRLLSEACPPVILTLSLLGKSSFFPVAGSSWHHTVLCVRSVEYASKERFFASPRCQDQSICNGQLQVGHLIHVPGTGAYRYPRGLELAIPLFLFFH